MSASPINENLYHFYAIAAVGEIPPGERIFLEINQEPVVVFNIAGYLYAIGDICTHDGGTLGDGNVEGRQVICPRHGARFDIQSGKALTLPAVTATPSYPVRVVNGQVEVGIPK
jgi:3-phenylpropionate/trans-cinnamate dioxygenase ferredoxin component